MEPYLAYFLGVIGAWMTILGYLDVRLARAVDRWPVVKGHLLSADVRTAPFGPGKVVVKVHYKYRVGEDHFEGERFTFRRFGMVNEAERALYRVTDAPTVEVHYDPKRPERAVLLPGAGSMSQVTMAAGVILLVVAAVLRYRAAA